MPLGVTTSLLRIVIDERSLDGQGDAADRLRVRRSEELLLILGSPDD